jgi:hypothetical protein
MIADVRYHVAMTVAYAALGAAYFAGTQFAVDLRPEPLEGLWYSWGPSVALLLLAVAVGFTVGRWWAVLGALGPLVVAVPLHLSGHITPWHDPTRPLDTAPLESALLAALTAFAVLARKRLGPRQPWSTLDENWSR